MDEVDKLAVMTLDALIIHLENLWQRPAAEWLEALPHIMLHTIRNQVTLAWSGADLLCDIFSGHPQELRWAQTCQTATRQWNQAFEIVEGECADTFSDQKEICQCLLHRLGPIIANSATLIEQAPVIELANQHETRVLNIVKHGLTRLAKISVALEQQDLTWLKELIDREETSPQGRTNHA